MQADGKRQGARNVIGAAENYAKAPEEKKGPEPVIATVNAVGVSRIRQIARRRRSPLFQKSDFTENSAALSHALLNSVLLEWTRAKAEPGIVACKFMLHRQFKFAKQ